MAEKAVEKLENQLNCSVCLDTYADPKLLQCHHVYCRRCLVKLVDRDQQGQLVLPCPICRQVTPIPTNGVAGLQSAFLIIPLLEIVEEHKKAAPGPPISAEDVEADCTSLPSKKIFCRRHIGKEMELFCETCEELICLECVVKSGKHFGHETELLKNTFQKYKKDITTSMEAIEAKLTIVNEALAQLDARCGEIFDQRAAVEVNIDNTFRQIHEALDARKTELISQLHQITQKKLKALAVQKDQIETTQAQLNSCLEFIRESLEKNNSHGEVLMMKTTIVKQVNELTTTFQPDLLKPNTEADIALSTVRDFTKECQNYGQVLSQASILDPSKCHITEGDVGTAVVGKASTAVLEAINIKGQPCHEPVKSSDCLLVSEITGTRVRGLVKRSSESQYDISYQPIVKGRHQLHVKVEGQHIRGSPFSVAVTSSVEKLGAPFLTIDRAKNPWGVAINQSGRVVVSEWSGDCVSVFSPNGEKLRSFGTHGSGKGHFINPAGVAVDAEGNILVVDYWNDRIQKFSATGQFLAAVGTWGNGRLQFQWPRGITVNTTNDKIYLCDSKNHRIQVLNSDLTFSSTFGKKGSSKGHFDHPYGIACDSAGNVYVADSNNHRIQVFTAEGKFLRMFGKRGEDKGKLKVPIGLAIDGNDILYISELDNHRISVFTLEGHFLKAFGGAGKGLGEFDKEISFLAVDSSGVVYVCDSNRIQLF